MRRTIDVHAFLSRLPLFKGLPADEIDRLAQSTTRRVLERGDVLFRRGEPSTGICALVYGRIRLSAAAPGGNERVVDVIVPGTTFGEAVMFLDKPYIVNATAMADSLVLHIAREAIFSGLERNPLFARRIIAGLAERVEGLIRDLHDYALQSAAKRFVAWLLRRREVGAAEHEATVVLPGAKRALASQLNLSAEHLSRVLNELSTQGLVGVRGRELTIPDVPRLRAWQADT